METQYLKYFVSVAETLSFTRASQLCCVSQPSLSAQIQKMEHLLGCSLFYRTKRNVMLTQEGEFLYPKAKRILDEIEDLGQCARDLANPLAGLISVGTTPLIAQSRIFHQLAQLKKQHPSIRYQCFEESTAHLVESLKARKYDMVLLPHTRLLEASWCQMTVLDEDQMVYVFPKGSTRNERQKLPFIATHGGCGLLPIMKRAADKLGFSIEGPYVAHHVDMVKNWVGLGLGWSLLPSRCLLDSDKTKLVQQKCERKIPIQYVAAMARGARATVVFEALKSKG